MNEKGIQFGSRREATWIFDMQNILELARFLNNAMPFNRPDDVIAFFEKPYRWTHEWTVYDEFKQSPEFEEYLDRNHIPDEVLKKLHRGS